MQPSPDSLHRVVDFVRNLRFEDIPARTVRTAKNLLLDTLGVAAAATHCKVAPIVGEIAVAAMAARCEADAACLLFDGRQSSKIGATYAGATTLDNLEGHDGFRRAKGHIGVALVPALLAFGQGESNVSGREALTALIVGYEIASRAGIALHAKTSDYHSSGAWNALGVAATVARIDQLSPWEVQAALGLAEFNAPRGLAMRGVRYPSMLGDGSGWGALVGATAVCLAKCGCSSAPPDLILGSDVTETWADLGTIWLIDEQYVKLHVICGFGHAAVDAAAALRSRFSYSASDIAQVEIGSFSLAGELDGGMPNNANEAQFRVAFAVAAMLARGQVGPEEMLGAGLHDAAVARIFNHTTFVERSAYDDRLPERWADLRVHLADGRVLESGEVRIRGGADQPGLSDEIRRKFFTFSEPLLGAIRAANIERCIDGFDDERRGLVELVQLTSPGPEINVAGLS